MASAEDKPRIITTADLEIFDYIPPERETQKRAAITKQIDELLRAFERESAGLVDVREVGTIARAVGLNPTESNIADMIEQIEESSSTGYVRSESLRNLLLSIRMTNEYKGKLMYRDSEATILQAFETLDKDKKGYLTAEYLKEVMISMGERFGAEELMEMINAAADPETGNVHYEDFATILATE